MIADTPCCPKCLQPLHVVCDKYGEHYTACRRIEPLQTEPRAKRVVRETREAPAVVTRTVLPIVDTAAATPTRQRRTHGTVGQRLLSAFEGESRTLAELTARTGLAYGHLSVELNAQMKKGTVRRVARGVYATTTERASA